jgi:hypothetical protein
MIVVIHKAIGIADKMKPRDGINEQVKKRSLVPLCPEYFCPGITSACHMVNGTGIFNSQRSHHGKDDSMGKSDNSRPDPMTFSRAFWFLDIDKRYFVRPGVYSLQMISYRFF